MNVKPYPGPRGVGGATPHPWGALADDFATLACRYARAFAAADPRPAAAAVFARQANAAITRQVTLTHALAEIARDHARLVTRTGERALLQGPLQRAFTSAASLQSDLAQILADATLRFGREFGHLAFAFRPPAKPPAATVCAD